MDKKLIAADEIYVYHEIEQRQVDDPKIDCANEHSYTKPPALAYALAERSRETSNNEGQSSSKFGEATVFEQGAIGGNRKTIFSGDDPQTSLYRRNFAQQSVVASSSFCERPITSGFSKGDQCCIIACENKKVFFIKNGRRASKWSFRNLVRRGVRVNNMDHLGRLLVKKLQDKPKPRKPSNE